MDVNVKKIKDNGGKENGWIIIIILDILWILWVATN